MQVRLRILRKAQIRRGTQLPVRLQTVATEHTTKREPIGQARQDQ